MKSEKEEKKIGILRKDLKLFSGDKSLNASKVSTIFDPVSGRYFRIHETEYEIISRLHKKYTLTELYKVLRKHNISVSQNKLVEVINFLNQNNLLLSSYAETERKLQQRKLLKQKLLSKKIANSYLSLSIPLWKPDAFLDRTFNFVKVFSNKWIILSFVVISLFGYIGIIANWTRFISTVFESFTLSGLIKYGITITVLKLMHEFAHAYAAKFAGVKVRKLGVCFIFFTPRFYIDITDSWQISDNRKRMLIDAAGILLELLLGGITAIIWLQSNPGVIKTIAYYTFAVSIINTVFINGNPLIKFDGYYLLMDFLNIDNLQKRSIEASKAFLYKYLLGIELKETAKEKKVFFIVFGLSSFVYRLFLYTGITLLIYYKFTKAIGIILAVLEVYSLLVKPLIKEVRIIHKIRSKINKRNSRISLGVASAFILVLIIPLPWTICAPCEVSSKQIYTIYAKNAGFLKNLKVVSGARVKKGETVLEQENPFLKWKQEKDNIELSILTNELDQMLSHHEQIEFANIKNRQVEEVHCEIQENNRKKLLLKTVTPISGIVVVFDRDLVKGKWLQKGERIGEIVDPDKKIIIAYLDEKEIHNIRLDDSVSINFYNELATYSGKVISITTIPNLIWYPSALLSDFGGPLKSKFENGKYVLQKNYYRIVILPEDKMAFRIGKTGNIQVRHYSSIIVSMGRDILEALQRELSF